MINENDHTARFDAYLFGEMTDAERAVFEKDLRENPALRAAFDEHRKFTEDLAKGAQYREITRELRSIHHALYTKPVSLFKNPKFLVPLSIAAVLVLGLLVIRPMMGGAGSGNAEQALAYDTATDSTGFLEEAPEMEVTTADAENEDATELPDHLLAPVSTETIGAAFMSRSDGYFMTTAGAVEGYDRVILQNRFGLTFETAVIYRDAKTGVAVLQCHPTLAGQFEPIPYYLPGKISGILGDTLLVLDPATASGLEKGHVDQNSGYSQSPGSFTLLFSDLPLPGTPVFSVNGELSGMITGKGNAGQALVLDAPRLRETMEKAAPGTYTEPDSQIPGPILNADQYAPFIFEVHP